MITSLLISPGVALGPDQANYSIFKGIYPNKSCFLALKATFEGHNSTISNRRFSQHILTFILFFYLSAYRLDSKFNLETFSLATNEHRCTQMKSKH